MAIFRSEVHRGMNLQALRSAWNNDSDNTRFLGSKDTLLQDLKYTNQDEKQLRNSQFIHDLLIYQVLSNYLKTY